jgi:hypothetical protein
MELKVPRSPMARYFANTCTLPKLKILVEICSIWDKSPDNDYKEELTITLDTICKVKS